MQDDITVTLDEGDFIDAYRPAPRRKRLSNLVLLLALMLALLIAALLARYPAAWPTLLRSPAFMGLIGAVVLTASLVFALLVSAPALRRYAARNTLTTHPGMRDPINYSFDDVRFAVRTTYSQAAYPWEQLWDWRESERVIIVLPTPRNFYLVPKRGIPSEVLDRLRSKLTKARRHANKAARQRS